MTRILGNFRWKIDTKLGPDELKIWHFLLKSCFFFQIEDSNAVLSGGDTFIVADSDTLFESL